jgi:hypothetical protein
MPRNTRSIAALAIAAAVASSATHSKQAEEGLPVITGPESRSQRRAQHRHQTSPHKIAIRNAVALRSARRGKSAGWKGEAKNKKAAA